MVPVPPVTTALVLLIVTVLSVPAFSLSNVPVSPVMVSVCPAIPVSTVAVTSAVFVPLYALSATDTVAFTSYGEIVNSFSAKTFL